MKMRRIIVLIVIGVLCGSSFGESGQPVPDTVEIQGGVVLKGNIVASSDEEIQLQTDFAGTVTILADKVTRIVTSKDIPASLAGKTAPAAAAQKAPPTDKPPAKPDDKTAVAAKAPAEPAPKAAPKPAPKPAPADDKYGWELEGGLNLAGNDGNTEKLDLGITIDSKYLQKFYRIDLYGRYNYGTSRDKLTADEVILGGRYTNFFYKRFGFFIREELERDKFELIDIRSTTAGGFSYKAFDSKTLDLELSSGLSYRYELDFKDVTEDYPGMDFGVDISWQFSPYLTYKGSYGFIPSFRSSEAFILTQNSSIDIPFQKNSPWKLRLGLTSKYNNQASRNREKLDNKYFVRLVTSWK